MNRFVHPATGYVFIKVDGHPRADYHGLVFEHIVIAEKALGRFIAEPNCIHHFNYKRGDNRNHNLVICEDAKYHKLLHVRQRIANAGGNPDLDKICTRCKTLKPKTDFTTARARWDGKSSTCLKCEGVYKKKWRLATGRAIKTQRSPLTRDEEADVVAWIVAGKSDVETAAHFGLVRSAIRWIKIRNNIPFIRRGEQTHCKKGGHPLVVVSGLRRCRQCHADDERRRRERAKLAS